MFDSSRSENFTSGFGAKPRFPKLVRESVRTRVNQGDEYSTNEREDKSDDAANFSGVKRSLAEDFDRRSPRNSLFGNCGNGFSVRAQRILKKEPKTQAAQAPH